MKKFFLLPLVLLLIGSTQLSAQCEPAEELPDTVIVSPLPYQEAFPERGLQDSACVGADYAAANQVQIPSTFTIGTTEVGVTSVDVTEQGIVGLPDAFNFACNPPDCVFLPNEIGCIEVFGNANPGDEGMYDLQISVVVNTAIAPIPYTLPDGELVPGNYFFFVKEEGNPNCLVAAREVVENAFDLRIQPNPFSDFSDIFVDLPQGGQYDLSVYNAVGTLVQQRKIDLVTGSNSFRFDGSNLAAGMYVFRLQQGTEAASGRLMIQR